MNPKKVILLSFLTISLTAILSVFIPISLFVRADGEVVPYSSEYEADFIDAGILKNIYVSEGDKVIKGQLIAELENSDIREEIKILEVKHKFLEHTIDSLDAIIHDESSDDIVLNLVDHNFKSHIKDLLSNKKLSLQMLKMYQRLYDKNATSLSKLNAAKVSYTKTIESYDKAIKDYKEKIFYQLESKRSQLLDLNHQLLLSKIKLKHTFLKSPINGVIKKVFFKHEQMFIAKNSTIAEIIPESKYEFKIKALVSGADISNIKKGDLARVRINTFDHSVFGYLDAKVTYVSRDKIEDSENGSYYVLYLLPDNKTFSFKNKNYILKYGMTATIMIKRGEVSAIKYLFKPMIKSFDNIGTL